MVEADESNRYPELKRHDVDSRKIIEKSIVYNLTCYAK